MVVGWLLAVGGPAAGIRRRPRLQRLAMCAAWLLAVGIAFAGGRWLGTGETAFTRVSGSGHDRVATAPKQGGDYYQRYQRRSGSSTPAPRRSGGKWLLPPSPSARPELPPDSIGSPPPDESVPGAYSAHALTGTSAVALTFDDGPDPTWTPKVLDLLHDNKITATFCVIGENAAAHPELVRRMVAEGHTLCNHSWNHDLNLAGYAPATIRADLERTNTAIHDAVPGAAVPYFRQPGGAWSPRVIDVAGQLGMASIHWDVDPQDWNLPGSTAIIKGVSDGVRPGSIVLLHDGGGDRSGTVSACESLLPYLRSRYRLTPAPAPRITAPTKGRYQLPD
jgi:peptidoglycan/xylan/chitin deacetylase (PgdA/CDA1 family)